LSVGVVGGTALTNDFTRQLVSFPGYPRLNYTETSTGRSASGGLILEWHVNSNWAVEVDGIYRGLHGSSPFPFGVVTWEFPVLAKYRFAFGRSAHPFLEGGAAFRTAANLNWANPSHEGVTAGTGLAIPIGRFELAPELRYTRWVGDNNIDAATKPDQIEVLLGFSGNFGSDRHPFSRWVTVGAVLGTNLTTNFTVFDSPTLIYLVRADGSTFVVNGTESGGSRGRSFLAGPSVQIKGPGRFAFEVDAIHTTENYIDNTYLANHVLYFSSQDGFGLWQLPVLAKYHLPVLFERGRLSEFLEAGPSFRLISTSYGASRYGITTGAGLELNAKLLRISPELRYCYWRPDSLSGLEHNQLQLLVSFAF
jgi:hypothetical protein